MKEYQFTSEDFNLLKELLKITRNIKFIYQDLYNLEINNKKNSDEFKKTTKILKYYIHKEDELYEVINNSIERLYFYCDYLFPNGCSEFEEEIEMLKNDNENDIFRMRLSNRLNFLINNYSFDDDLSEDEENVFDDELAVFTLEEEYKRCLLVENFVKEDIYNAILTILDKYINQEEYSFMKNKLIKFKYNYSYMCKTTECSMLNNNFSISDKLYIESILISEFLGVEENYTFKNIRNFIDELYNDQMRDLSYLIREEKNKDIRNEQIILTIVLLRAIIMFMTKDEVINFKNTVNLELLLSMLDNKMVIEIINEMFSEREKDMEIPKVLSLKPLN